MFAESQALRLNARFRCEKPRSQLLPRHLKGKERDFSSLSDPRVARDVQGEARLTEAWAGGKDNQIGSFEPAEQRVQVHESGADLCRPLPGFCFPKRLIEKLVE